MAVPIANDWKAIHDRMQQIQAERSPSFRRCRMCNNMGWIPELRYDGRSHEGRVAPCYLCGNPKKLTPPRFIPR
jgi:hypothetical protein